MSIVFLLYVNSAIMVVPFMPAYFSEWFLLPFRQFVGRNGYHLKIALVLLIEFIKISHDKIAFIAQYLSDKSLLSENIVQEDEKIENVGVALEKVSKIKDIQDNINEKYEKDVQRSAELNEEDSDAKTDEVSEDEGGE